MDLDMAKWIIGGMAFGYVLLGGYIAKLHLEIKALWGARVTALEAQLAALTEEE